MTIKVAAWNMGHCMRQGVAQQTWNFLEKNIDADISLVQESVPPVERQNKFCVWREIGGTRKWGLGVLTKKFPVTEIKLERNDYPGSLIVADATLPDKSKLVVVSMYGLLDKCRYSKHRYSITTLHRMLSDLTHLFAGAHQHRGRPKVILGGDLNASLQFDDEYEIKTHRIFFQRLEAFGLRDCQGQFTKDRPPTLRHRRSRIPWVNDYIFASESLAKKVVAHEVIERPEILKLSDHNPVVVTFDL
jgi:endonuclease/exonuclease/phosphatase family metal-dependent hydrolase